MERRSNCCYTPAVNFRQLSIVRLVMTQAFIFTLCGVMRWAYDAPWPTVAVFFGVMQLAGLLGTWWGNRIRRLAEQKQGELPPLDRQ